MSAAMLLFAATLSVSCQKEDIPIYSPEDMEREELIKNYLATSYSSAITDVSVTEDKVRISGKYSGTGEFYVSEIPPYMDRLRLEEALTLFEPDGSSFSFETGRMVETENGIVYDRLLSKWAIFEKNGEGSRLVSAARYADEVHAVSSPDAVPLRNKKGMGGIFMNDRISDFDELGLGSATLNLFVTQFAYLSPGAGRIPHEYGGRTYWFDSKEEGAKLGLRKYNDDVDQGTPKPVWYAYRQAGESGQDEYFAEQGFEDMVGPEWNVIHPVE